MNKAAIGVAAAAITLLPLGAAWAADTCVWVRNLNDFKPLNDDKTVIVSDTPSRKFTVTLVGRCTGLRFAETLGVRAVGDEFCLTPGDFISFSSAGITRQCIIDKIEPYVESKPAPTPAAQGQPQGY